MSLKHSTDPAPAENNSVGFWRSPAIVNFVYRITWLSGRAAFKLWFNWRTYNAERVPVDGPVIVAVNHASFADPPLVGCSLPRQINYLARESLFRFPIIGWYLRCLCAVPVDRDGGGAKGLKTILDRLLSGGGIVLFPEGTRTSDGKLQPARSGIGLTVIKSNAPVVPVHIFGAFEAYGRHIKFPRRKPVVVKYGKPMMFETLRAEAKTCPKPRLKEIYQEVADQLMAEIAKLEPKED